jgi:hypothetical protein
MRRSPTWTEAHDAEFRHLVQMGYSAARLHVHFHRSMVFVLGRAKVLGLTIKKPSRLPANERAKG